MLTPTQTRVARNIMTFARSENLKEGDQLVESALAQRIGTSRTPVNVALRHLVTIGAVTHDAHRGFFLAKDASALSELATRFSTEADDPLYQRIAEDRLARRLPDNVLEADLMRSYGASRNALRKVLGRIQQEDWVEKSTGHGWKFLPMIDSQAAYEESYLFRSAIEPAGISGPGFRLDPQEYEILRRQQLFIVSEGFASMTVTELFEANCRFHESLAKWSGNRFILQGVRRTDRLRRLIEYRQAANNRSLRREQVIEHLEILDAIAAGELSAAAERMRAHLDEARLKKTSSSGVFAPPQENPAES